MHPTLMHALPEGGGGGQQSDFFPSDQLFFSVEGILASVRLQPSTPLEYRDCAFFSLFPIHTNPMFFGLIQVRITFGWVRARASAFVCASTEHLSCFLLPFFLRS